MTITSSGTIAMSDIRSELGDSGSISLKEASDGTIATINTANDADDRPDGSAPHAMSEFYSYDHNASAANTSFGTFSDTTIRFVGLSPGGNVANHAQTTSALTDASGSMTHSENITSGTRRGGLVIACSNSGDPGAATNNSFAGGESNSGSGYQSIDAVAALGPSNTVTFSGSVTMHLRFAFLPHSSLTESTSGTVSVTNNGTTNSTIGTTTSVTSFGGFCVGEYVPVNTPDGYKHISELSVGDKVMTFNLSSNAVEESEILQIESPKHSDLVNYYFEDMQDIEYRHGRTLTINRGLTITKDHPLYKADGTMVCLDPVKAKELYGLDAQEIQKNDEIRFMDKIRKVTHYLNSPDELDTYTILTSNDNFFAGGVLVHSEIS